MLPPPVAVADAPCTVPPGVRLPAEMKSNPLAPRTGVDGAVGTGAGAGAAATEVGSSTISMPLNKSKEPAVANVAVAVAGARDEVPYMLVAGGEAVDVDAVAVAVADAAGGEGAVGSALGGDVALDVMKSNDDDDAAVEISDTAD
jgi:hypothetical protein